MAKTELSPKNASRLVFIACAALGLTIHFSSLIDGVDRKILDLGFALERAYFPKSVANDVVIVGIDEAFLRGTPEPIALLHEHLGILFEAIAAGKPKVVGLDIVLPDRSFAFLAPRDRPEVNFDELLAKGLLKLGAAAPLIVSETWDHHRGQFGDLFVPFLGAASQWTQAKQSKFDVRGSALFCLDADGLVRKYPGPDCQPGGRQSTLTERIAVQAGLGSDWSGLIDYGSGPQFQYISGRDLVSWFKSGDVEKLATLRNRAVLVGTILDTEDRLRIPVPLLFKEPTNKLVPGVVVHAQVLRTMLNSGFIKPVPVALTVLLILLAARLALFHRMAAAFACYFTGVIALLSTAAFLLGIAWFIPTAAVLFTATLALVVGWAVAARRHWLERQNLTRTFNGYVSPAVLKGIISGALSPAKAGAKRQVCVMFTDIRDFTTMSEGLPANRVVELLNDYFDSMARIVHAHGGTVDKFIGDGMMAVFGNPQPLANPEKNALDASQEMLIALIDLNRDFARRGLPTVRIGIGLHSGEAVIGHLGSRERHEYTAIGDAVNVAARVCDLPKKLGKPIACTESVAKAVGYPDFLIDAGLQSLKGHTEMRVYSWEPKVLAALQGE